MKPVIEMILLCLVGAEGRGRTRGRLTLRLLRSQHTAATADSLMVFTATICHISEKRRASFARCIPAMMSILAASLRVMFCAKKMQRYVRLIAHDPTIAAGANVKQIAGVHFVGASVFHLARGAPGHSQADMLHFA